MNGDHSNKRRYPTFRKFYLDPSELEGVVADTLSAAALPVDGQIFIGKSDGLPEAANLTAGVGIDVSNGPGSVVISNTHVTPSLQDGQLLIGSTGGEAVPANITAGNGITVTNGSGSITVSQNVLNVSKVGMDNLVTTNSIVYGNLGGMSLTPGAGSFLILFDGVISHDRDARSSSIMLFLDEVPINNTFRTEYLEKKEDVDHMGTMAYVTGVTSGQVISMRWKTVNVDTIATFHNRTMVAIKLAN